MVILSCRTAPGSLTPSHPHTHPCLVLYGFATRDTPQASPGGVLGRQIDVEAGRQEHCHRHAGKMAGVDCSSTHGTSWQESQQERVEHAYPQTWQLLLAMLLCMYMPTARTHQRPAELMLRVHATVAAAAMRHCQCNLPHPRHTQGQPQHMLTGCPCCPAKTLCISHRC